MEVTFKRTAQRRYAVVVNRPGASALAMHPAPGYDPLLPHDLAHFIVERECGIALGVFGQLAAGGDAATFHRSDGVVDRKLRRRGERLARENRAELGRWPSRPRHRDDSLAKLRGVMLWDVDSFGDAEVSSIVA